MIRCRSILILWVILSPLIISAFPLYQLTPANPCPGDTLFIQFTPRPADPDFTYIHFAFNLPYYYNSDNLKINRVVKAEWREKFKIVLPQDASLLYVYLEDRKGNIVKEDNSGTFFALSTLSGKPARNAFFYQALILRDINPHHYAINSALEKEIQFYPDNFPAYYFQWKQKNKLNHPDTLSRIINQLNELEKTYFSSPEYWEIKGRIGEIIQDPEMALSAYRTYMALSDSLDNKFLILSRMVFLSDDLTDYDSLIQTMFNQVAGSGRFQLFLSLLQKYQTSMPEKTDQFLDQALKSEDYTTRELAAYSRLLSLFGQNQTASTEIPGLFGIINYPRYLTAQQLNRLTNLLAFYPEYKKEFMKFSQYAYHQYLKIGDQILTLDTTLANQWNFLRISILENYAWSLYLNDNLTESLEACQELILLSLVPDDILYYRIGLIYYANDMPSQSLDYLGKSYILNFQPDVLATFTRIYYELYGENSPFDSYLENLKYKTYQKTPFRDWLSQCSVNYTSQKSILLVFSPLSPISLDDFDHLSQVKNSQIQINFISLFRSAYPLTAELQSAFSHYELPLCQINPSALNIVSSVSESSFLLLFDEQDYLINRLSFYRPDWREVLDAFIRSGHWGE